MEKINNRRYTSRDIELIVADYNDFVNRRSKGEVAPALTEPETKDPEENEVGEAKSIRLNNISKIRALIQSDSRDDKEDILEMLEDLRTKVRDNEKNPELYLSAGLRYKFKEQSDLLKLLDKVIPEEE